MRYYEKLDYQLSRRFKESTAIDLLNIKLDRLPFSILKSICYKEEPYEIEIQGDKIKYEIDEETGNINVFLDTYHDLKKKYILLEIKRRGNEVNIITKSPKEDTLLYHVRHNANNTVQSINRRIKYYNKDNEQLLESRYALFSDDGDLLKYNEEEFDNNQYIKHNNY